jgi:transcriptional regulator with XRE-family HTH domain
MDDKQAKALGKLLRDRRTKLGLSLRSVEERSGVRNNTIVRFEQGEFATPDPDKLGRISAALDLSLSDVYALAGYPLPELPTFTPYLRTKYRELSDDDIGRIERYATRLAKKHGITLSGPQPGEDE